MRNTLKRGNQGEANGVKQYVEESKDRSKKYFRREEEKELNDGEEVMDRGKEL